MSLFFCEVSSSEVRNLQLNQPEFTLPVGWMVMLEDCEKIALANEGQLYIAEAEGIK